MAKVIIYLREHGFTALNDQAQRGYRAPKLQAALMIRKELQKLGMIPCEQLTHARRPQFLVKGSRRGGCGGLTCLLEFLPA